MDGPLAGVPDIDQIVADCDLDGLMATAVLKKCYPAASVRFGHPAKMRTSEMDAIITRSTAICDLPFHPECGLWLDHHDTNAPSPEQIAQHEAAGGKTIWEPLPSAARVTYEMFKDHFDLSSFAPMMNMVDKIDSGQITPEEYLNPDATQLLSRTISMEVPDYVLQVLEWLVADHPLDWIMEQPPVSRRVELAERRRLEILELLPVRGRLVDRLGIIRLDGTSLSSNGFVFTAYWGDECDAVCVVKGFEGGGLESGSKPPLGASFYNNAFLNGNQGVMNLTLMAKSLDPTGGGHRNACGCRIVALDDQGNVENRSPTAEDIEANIDAWVSIWREHTSA